MTVVERLLMEHNRLLIVLALLQCGGGAWVTARLFSRSTATRGLQRAGWLFLAALAGGVAIWCTHFVAMLGFHASVPVRFEPTATIASLLIAVFGGTLGFTLAGGWRWQYAGAVGGGIVGLSIVAMHYVGMDAYRVQGRVTWDLFHVVASVFFAVGFAAVAVQSGMSRRRYARDAMAGLLSVAILSLHFTAMAAFQVEPAPTAGTFSDPAGLHALAITVVGLSLVIVAAGLASYLIDDRVRAETVEHLRRMALSDPLTGLPNRAHFLERLQREIDLARADGTTLALIGIDLNHFKDINDLRGHSAGDEVLWTLSERLMHTIQPAHGEFVARTGGDEFAATFRVHDDGELHAFIARLEAALFAPMDLESGKVVPGASLGVALWPSDATDPTNLINNADLAMYRAKSDPSRNVCFYEASMDERVRARRSLVADLREALERGELQMHYQVQCSVATGRAQGYEALMRWAHPRLGPVSPQEFIPLAEENGLILSIGEWALRDACVTAARWEHPYRAAVNISAQQFAHADLPQQVADALAHSGLAPERLELELTESTIFADKPHALRSLREIRALGVRIALDDFGTGYSSLDILRSFAFDRIKLDRSFIAEANTNAPTIAVVRAVIALGKSLGIPVLAEGIETVDQFTLLDREGCDEVQGYLLGYPEPMHQTVMPFLSTIQQIRTAAASTPHATYPDWPQRDLRILHQDPRYLDVASD